jgi:UDP-N-acetyl-D-glucosamine dehydrogenase
MTKICVIGLGYVGLPLACLCARKGYEVYGYDVDSNKVDLINKKVSPIKDQELEDGLKLVDVKATTDPSVIRACDVVFVCVPTPIKENYMPDLRFVEGAVETICQNLNKSCSGQLVIIESTIHPGTCEEVIMPIFDKFGLIHNRDFFLAHCPERIDPGNKKWNVENIPRVVGGLSSEATNKAVELYRNILVSGVDVMSLSSIKAAEAVKITENTFRDVNIAFVNELAMSFDKLGIDVTEVIKGASTKPFAFMPHWPSCGVGGHCIPVDPYYLIEHAKSKGFDHSFLSLARNINKKMPEYSVVRLEEALSSIGKSIDGTKIGVLGLAYKGNVDDTRESPAFEVIELLQAKGAEVFVFDPYLMKESHVGSVEDMLNKVEVLFLVTEHNEFKNFDFSKLNGTNVKVIIDGKNCLDKAVVESYGIIYKGIGR